MSLNASAYATPARRPTLADAVEHPRRRHRARCCSLVRLADLDVHRGRELAGVCVERGELGVDEAVTSSTWSGSSASNSSRAVGRQWSTPCSREEVRIARRHDPRRSVASRRAGDRGAAGSAATGRGRARRRAAAGGSSPATSRRSASVDSSSPSTAPRNTTSPVAPSALAAARCSSWRVATSAAVSAAGSHVPFEPSVHTRWWTTQPAAAHLASVRAAPELDVVGMGGDGQRTRRHRTGSAARQLGELEVGRHVDVPPEAGRATRGRQASRSASARWRSNEPGP